MGLFGKIFDSVNEKVQTTKEQKAQDQAFVRRNPGSKAICAYFAKMFDKGGAGYDWLKQNRTPLYPVVKQDSVSICYMQVGDGQSFSGMKSKDVAVGTYTFSTMYQWYGLSPQGGYAQLTTKTQRETLEAMINAEVEKLPHIKYNGGYLVKLFG